MPMLYIKTRKDISNYTIIDTDTNKEVILSYKEIKDMRDKGVKIKGVSERKYYTPKNKYGDRIKIPRGFYDIVPYKLDKSGNSAKLSLLLGIDTIITEDKDLYAIGIDIITEGVIRLSDYCSHVCASAFKIFGLFEKDDDTRLIIVLDDKVILDGDCFMEFECKDFDDYDKPRVLFDISEVTRKDTIDTVNKLETKYIKY
jgi:hypothetical protein